MAEFETGPQEKLTIEKATARLRQIRSGLEQATARLREKIEIISSEPELQISLENLKRDTETRASSLEAEVKRLREDLKAVRELLGDNSEKRNSLKS
jgi:LPS O-antigen subunit length determinant protein (WzzB/FepE family)